MYAFAAIINCQFMNNINNSYIISIGEYPSKIDLQYTRIVIVLQFSSD